MHIDGKVTGFEDISTVVKKVSVEIPWAEVQKETNDAYKKLQKQVNVRGFRQGKVPRAILEKQYGDAIRHETVQELAAHFLEHYLEDQKIIPVAPPVIESHKYNEGESLEFAARIEIRPTVELENYRGIEVSERAVEVSDAELETELGRVREAHAQVHPVEGRDVTQKGDLVFFEMAELKGGSELKKQSHTAELGDGRLNPILEARLTGIKTGETLELELPSEKEGPKRFSVKVTEIKTKVLPELTDDFARDMGQFADLGALREEIRGRLLKGKEDKAGHETEEELVKEIISSNPFAVPESMVNRQIEAFAENFKRQFGIKDVNMEAFRSEMSARALYTVQRALILDAVAKREGLEAGDEDVEAEFQKIAKENNRNAMWVRAQYEKEGMIEDLKYMLRERKVVDFLIREAKKVQKAVEAPKAEAKAE
ncbi:MAG: trigger factor [Myxococcota bacterium]|jgi:trigger factor